MISREVGRLVLAVVVAIAGAIHSRCAAADGKVFRAGAAAVDVSPTKFPVIVNGGFLEATANSLVDPLFIRGLVLDDGTTRLAIAVIDSCMLPRELIDRGKELAHQQTGIPVDRMLISATHTHSAPSACGALGTRADANYVAFLPPKLAEVIVRAAENLAPAQIGWGVVDDFEHTHCRRWIRRPDKVIVDPFGEPTARANMHPGYQNPDAIGPSGPVDPGLSVLSIRSADGKPLALLANYSMHYFGIGPVSSDYYGRFATQISRLIGAEGGSPAFVAMMSQGTSGDQHWMDYSKPQDPIKIDAYAESVARKAFEAYRAIEHHAWVPLAMAEKRLTLRRRVPDERRLAWARGVVESMGDRPPKTLPEVYAREAIYLHDEPERELKLQAIRIGDLGIAAIPNEVFALTGLKIKAQSPFAATFTIELANGGDGYIPPPEQHALGGYTTWPARTAGLEVQAEPKIVAAVLELLEKVAGRPRRKPQESSGPYARAVLDSKPVAYWRLGEMAGTEPTDATGNGHAAKLEGGAALFLEGPRSGAFSGDRVTNRAVHLAGGHLNTQLQQDSDSSSVELWFWNGLPNDARAETGVLVAREAGENRGEYLTIGGRSRAAGRLIFATPSADGVTLEGKTPIAPKTWHLVVLVRDTDAVTVYLDGQPEMHGRVPSREREARLLIGGSGRSVHLEGKVDEAAVFSRALTAAEAAGHYRVSGVAANALD